MSAPVGAPFVVTNARTRSDPIVACVLRGSPFKAHTVRTKTSVWINLADLISTALTPMVLMSAYQCRAQLVTIPRTLTDCAPREHAMTTQRVKRTQYLPLNGQRIRCTKPPAETVSVSPTPYLDMIIPSIFISTSNLETKTKPLKWRDGVEIKWLSKTTNHWRGPSLMIYVCMQMYLKMDNLSRGLCTY